MTRGRLLLVCGRRGRLGRSPRGGNMGRRDGSERLRRFHVSGAKGGLAAGRKIGISRSRRSLGTNSHNPALVRSFRFERGVARFSRRHVPRQIIRTHNFNTRNCFRICRPVTRCAQTGFLRSPSIGAPIFIHFSAITNSHNSTSSMHSTHNFTAGFCARRNGCSLINGGVPIFFVRSTVGFPSLIRSFGPRPRGRVPRTSATRSAF